jgi:hypothetical protein
MGDVHERERDARIEELLLVGLDHYFAEQYDLAINVWTRVLFIDRGHARARAYIERARGAIAERLRKGDELLHSSTIALNRGDAERARELVTSAVEHGAAADEALSLMARIERLSGAGPGASAAASDGVGQRHPVVTAVTRARSTRWRLVGAGAIGGVVLGAVALVAVARGIPLPFFAGPEFVPVSTLNAPLPVPTIGETALANAQVLYARGRLQEALVALAGVPSGDPHRPRADDLAASIQRQLLAAARSTGRAASRAVPRRR